MQKIYIAGPDVFEKNSIEIGQKMIALCEKYGFKGLYPLDNVVDFSQEKSKIALDIYQANRAMIDKADIVIANLNPFRGKEADSGTVWECGYACGIGKKVYGYINDKCTYVERFEHNEKSCKDDFFTDCDGKIIEDFELPINLMIACSCTQIITGNFEAVLQTLA